MDKITEAIEIGKAIARAEAARDWPGYDTAVKRAKEAQNRGERDATWIKRAAALLAKAAAEGAFSDPVVRRSLAKALTDHADTVGTGGGAR